MHSITDGQRDNIMMPIASLSKEHFWELLELNVLHIRSETLLVQPSAEAAGYNYYR